MVSQRAGYMTRPVQDVQSRVCDDPFNTLDPCSTLKT